LMESFRDDRVRIFSCSGSHVEAHQLGVSEARGELIARMDADDVSHPERIARQLALLSADRSLSACTCGVQVCSRDREIGDGFLKYVDWLNGLATPEDIARERFIESPVVHPASMVRREALMAVGGYQEVDWAEDYDLWLRFLASGQRIGMVPEILFDWYDSDSRLTRTHERYSQENFLRAKAHYLAALPQVRDGGVAICGAGPIGKRIGRLLIDEGVRVRVFYEVNPRRIGESIAGVPVRDQAEMRRGGGEVLLGAVGLEGARDVIRGLGTEQGYLEGDDFFCIA
jgi:glycosyltransferase involved in cell wall biosynthesis